MPTLEESEKWVAGFLGISVEQLHAMSTEEAVRLLVGEDDS